MVVDRLEIFRGNAVSADSIVRIQSGGHIAHKVLDELWIIVGAFRDIFFVGAFEQAIDFAGGLLFCNPDQFLKPQVTAKCRRNGDVRALVVSAVIGDFLGTRA